MLILRLNIFFSNVITLNRILYSLKQHYVMTLSLRNIFNKLQLKAGFISISRLKNFEFHLSKFFSKMKYFSNDWKYEISIDTKKCNNSFFIELIVKISPREYHSVSMLISRLKNC